MKKKSTAHPKKRGEKSKRTGCPYLSESSKRICRKMIEKGLDGRVSSFDVEHFCKGNPFYCYYFRFHSSKKQKGKIT